MMAKLGISPSKNQQEMWIEPPDANTFIHHVTGRRLAQVAYPSSRSIDRISMRYGRKQLKIRQRVKSDLQKVVTIDDLAEVISSPEFYLANRRMSGRLMTKIQKKAASLGYQLCGKSNFRRPTSLRCAMALSLHAIDAELPA